MKNTVTKSGSQVDPLRGWELQSIKQMNVSRGVAFVAKIFFEGQYIGDIKNLGFGCTHKHCIYSTESIWFEGEKAFKKATDIKFEPLDAMLEWLVEFRGKNMPLKELQDAILASALS